MVTLDIHSRQFLAERIKLNWKPLWISIWLAIIVSTCWFLCSVFWVKFNLHNGLLIFIVLLLILAGLVISNLEYGARKPVKFFCPHCSGYIEKDICWTCRLCDDRKPITHNTLRTPIRITISFTEEGSKYKDYKWGYTFLFPCSKCDSLPNIFECPRCEQDIFLEEWTHPERRAAPHSIILAERVRAYEVMELERNRPEIERQLRAAQLRELKERADYEAAKLQIQIDLENARKKVMTPEERIQAEWKERKRCALFAMELATRERERNDEDNSHHPELRDKVNEVIDQFLDDESIRSWE